jgi:hypothetical protein
MAKKKDLTSVYFEISVKDIHTFVVTATQMNLQFHVKCSYTPMTIKLNIDTNVKDIISEYLERYQIAHCYDCFDPANERATLICYCSTIMDVIYVSYLALFYGGLKINDLVY